MTEETSRRGQGDFCSELPAQTPCVAHSTSLLSHTWLCPASPLPPTSYLYFQANPALLSEALQRDLYECCACKCLLGVPSFSPWFINVSLYGFSDLFSFYTLHGVLFSMREHHRDWQDFRGNGPASSWTSSYQLSNSELLVGKSLGSRSLRAKACLVACGRFWRSFQVICSSTTEVLIS